MRSEEEMYKLIVKVASEDERVRAVYLNGSRTHPEVKKDVFQDYDVVYVVRETDSFRIDKEWIRVFGDILIVQEPDHMDLLRHPETVNLNRTYGYLMLFEDGNRIDLRLQVLESLYEDRDYDSFSISLLDKDGCLPTRDRAAKVDYRVKCPSEQVFKDCCNEFWWCMQNVAKGIWRDELPYAKGMFEGAIRPEMDEMVAWWIGTKHDFQVSVGKMGKHYKQLLPQKYWEEYKKTYSGADYERFWEAIFSACSLFGRLAAQTAQHLKYEYCEKEEKGMLAYLHQVEYLPHTAESIFSEDSD